MKLSVAAAILVGQGAAGFSHLDSLYRHNNGGQGKRSKLSSQRSNNNNPITAHNYQAGNHHSEEEEQWNPTPPFDQYQQYQNANNDVGSSSSYDRPNPGMSYYTGTPRDVPATSTPSSFSNEGMSSYLDFIASSDDPNTSLDTFYSQDRKQQNLSPVQLQSVPSTSMAAPGAPADAEPAFKSAYEEQLAKFSSSFRAASGTQTSTPNQQPLKSNTPLLSDAGLVPPSSSNAAGPTTSNLEASLWASSLRKSTEATDDDSSVKSYEEQLKRYSTRGIAPTPPAAKLPAYEQFKSVPMEPPKPPRGKDYSVTSYKPPSRSTPKQPTPSTTPLDPPKPSPKSYAVSSYKPPPTPESIPSPPVSSNNIGAPLKAPPKNYSISNYKPPAKPEPTTSKVEELSSDSTASATPTSGGGSSYEEQMAKFLAWSKPNPSPSPSPSITSNNNSVDAKTSPENGPSKTYSISSFVSSVPKESTSMYASINQQATDAVQEKSETLTSKSKPNQQLTSIQENLPSIKERISASSHYEDLDFSQRDDGPKILPRQKFDFHNPFGMVESTTVASRFGFPWSTTPASEKVMDESLQNSILDTQSISVDPAADAAAEAAGTLGSYFSAVSPDPKKNEIPAKAYGISSFKPGQVAQVGDLNLFDFESRSAGNKAPAPESPTSEENSEDVRNVSLQEVISMLDGSIKTDEETLPSDDVNESKNPNAYDESADNEAAVDEPGTSVSLRADFDSPRARRKVKRRKPGLPSIVPLASDVDGTKSVSKAEKIEQQREQSRKDYADYEAKQEMKKTPKDLASRLSSFKETPVFGQDPEQMRKNKQEKESTRRPSGSQEAVSAPNMKAGPGGLASRLMGFKAAPVQGMGMEAPENPHSSDGPAPELYQFDGDHESKSEAKQGPVSDFEGVRGDSAPGGYGGGDVSDFGGYGGKPSTNYENASGQSSPGASSGRKVDPELLQYLESKGMSSANRPPTNQPQQGDSGGSPYMTSSTPGPSFEPIRPPPGAFGNVQNSPQSYGQRERETSPYMSSSTPGPSFEPVKPPPGAFGNAQSSASKSYDHGQTESSQYMSSSAPGPSFEPIKPPPGAFGDAPSRASESYQDPTEPSMHENDQHVAQTASNPDVPQIFSMYGLVDATRDSMPHSAESGKVKSDVSTEVPPPKKDRVSGDDDAPKSQYNSAPTERSTEASSTKEVTQPKPNPNATPLAARLQKFKNTDPFSDNEKSRPKPKVEEEPPVYSPPKTPLAARLDKFKKTKAFDEVRRPKSRPKGIFEKNAEAAEAAAATRSNATPMAARWESFKGISPFKSNDFQPKTSLIQERGAWGATGRKLIEYQVGRGAEQFDEPPPASAVPGDNRSDVANSPLSKEEPRARFRVAHAKKRQLEKKRDDTTEMEASLGEFKPFESKLKAGDKSDKQEEDTAIKPEPVLGTDISPKKSTTKVSALADSPGSRKDEAQNIAKESKSTTDAKVKSDSTEKVEKKTTLISFPTAKVPKVERLKTIKKGVDAVPEKPESKMGKADMEAEIKKAIEKAKRNPSNKNLSKSEEDASSTKATTDSKKAALNSQENSSAAKEEDPDLVDGKKMNFVDGLFENMFGSKEKDQKKEIDEININGISFKSIRGKKKEDNEQT
jgi:hypothetical protein